ncbi:MAG TPA: ORF6N domain-containing protein [bacterium]|nr:ORF6N domain-containing protein [bacterium]
MTYIEKVENSIFLIRGFKVLLSTDLAILYGVPPKVFIQAVKRNIRRFPHDFMFKLTHQEMVSLRSQFVTLEKGKGKYSKYPPYAFTEQGVAMLSSVLNSPKAIQVNIQIMRTFVKLRQLMASNADLAKKIDELERKYDGHFTVVFEAIRELVAVPASKTRKIGFLSEPQMKYGGDHARN